MWLLWIIAGLALAGGGFATRRAGLVAIALAALPAGLVAAVGGGVAAWVVFLLVAAALSFGVWRLRSARPRTAQAALGAEELIGLSGIVVERIANQEAVGSIRVGRQVWTARSYHDGFVIDVGARVEVVDARGATALVE